MPAKSTWKRQTNGTWVYRFHQDWVAVCTNKSDGCWSGTLEFRGQEVQTLCSGFSDLSLCQETLLNSTREYFELLQKVLP